MPYIVKKLESELVDVANQKTLILDVEKTAELTKELDLLGELGHGITYKEVLKLRESFGDLSSFQGLLVGENSKWISIIKQIENIEEFYNIVWERTIVELMFISQYYISLISTPQSFEKVLNGGSEFEFWFLNSVKYNMLEKVKDFYMKTIRAYANNISLDVYETDVLIKAKEVMDEIENNHLNQVKDLLETTWNNTEIEYKKWLEKETNKRKTIIFD